MSITTRRGFRLFYEVHGQGTRTPLLLIMGMGGTSRGWTVGVAPAEGPPYAVKACRLPYLLGLMF